MTIASQTLRARVARFIDHPKFLIRCFLAFVAIRLAFVLFLPVQPSSDASWYLARGIVLSESGSYSQNGIPTAYWPVGYPAFLGLLFALTGPSLLAAKLANLAFAACSFWLLYFVVRSLSGAERAARGALLLLTVYPNHIAYTPLILTELLFTMLFLAACMCLLGKRTTMYIVLAGILVGLATLIKTQTILIGPALAFVAYCDHWRWKVALGAGIRAVVVGIVALLTIMPWSLRNYHVFGTFVLVSTNGGMALLAGNNPSVVGDYRIIFSDNDPLVAQARFSVADQVGADKRAAALAVNWILANPADFLSIVPKKVFWLWGPDGEAEWQYQAGTIFYDDTVRWFRSARIVNQAYYVVVILLFFWAFFRLVKSRPSGLRPYFGYILAGLLTALCIVFSGQSRYHFPVMPFAFAYVAWALTGMPRNCPNKPVTSLSCPTA